MWARCAKMGARAQSPINEGRALWGDQRRSGFRFALCDLWPTWTDLNCRAFGGVVHLYEIRANQARYAPAQADSADSAEASSRLAYISSGDLEEPRSSAHCQIRPEGPLRIG